MSGHGHGTPTVKLKTVTEFSEAQKKALVTARQWFSFDSRAREQVGPPPYSYGRSFDFVLSYAVEGLRHQYPDLKCGEAEEVWAWAYYYPTAADEPVSADTVPAYVLTLEVLLREDNEELFVLNNLLPNLNVRKVGQLRSVRVAAAGEPADWWGRQLWDGVEEVPVGDV